MKENRVLRNQNTNNPTVNRLNRALRSLQCQAEAYKKDRNLFKAQRDELLAVLRKSEIAIRYIRDYARPYKTVNAQFVANWAQNNCEKMEAAIIHAA